MAESRKSTFMDKLKLVGMNESIGTVYFYKTGGVSSGSEGQFDCIKKAFSEITAFVLDKVGQRADPTDAVLLI